MSRGVLRIYEKMFNDSRALIHTLITKDSKTGRLKNVFWMIFLFSGSVIWKNRHISKIKDATTRFSYYFSFWVFFCRRDCVSLSFGSQNELKNKTTAELFLVSVGLENTLQSVFSIDKHTRTSNRTRSFCFPCTFICFALRFYMYIFVDRLRLKYVFCHI